MGGPGSGQPRKYHAGHRFGKWTILEILPSVKTARKWRCRCDCGVVRVQFAANLVSGKSKACGSCAATERERKKREERGK